MFGIFKIICVKPNTVWHIVGMQEKLLNELVTCDGGNRKGGEQKMEKVEL